MFHLYQATISFQIDLLLRTVEGSIMSAKKNIDIRIKKLGTLFNDYELKINLLIGIRKTS